jgi:hypothetical protein
LVRKRENFGVKTDVAASRHRQTTRAIRSRQKESVAAIPAHTATDALPARHVELSGPTIHNATAAEEEYIHPPVAFSQCLLEAYPARSISSKKHIWQAYLKIR